MNLSQEFKKVFIKSPTKVAVNFADKQISFRELDFGSNRVANGLASLGVKKGDRVCLFVPNCIEFILSHLGVLKLGAITVPMNVMYKGREIEHILSNSEAKVLITTQDKLSLVEGVSSRLPKLRQIIVVGGTSTKGIPYEKLSEASTEEPRTEIEDNDLALICYTSGTTGRPKGAMLTHGNLISNSKTLINLWEWTDKDVFLLSLPMTHVHGLGVGLHGALLTGSPTILMEKFKAEDALSLIQEFKCSLFMGVPTMYTRFLQVSGGKAYDLSCMRLFISGSAPLPIDTFHRFREVFGFEILERYGMTETMMNTSNPYHGKRKPGTVGLPLPGVQARIVDSQWGDVPEGETGEILVKGPNVFKGYWNLPDETAQAFRDGWLKTGDLGKKDEDGYISIVGRSKDLIISGGFNVYPREVEEVLCSHPHVEEAAVIGIPDQVRGEAVKAYVVLKSGEKVSEEELITFCRENLAIFKVPQEVEFIPQLPRTASGKVIVHELCNLATSK